MWSYNIPEFQGNQHDQNQRNFQEKIMGKKDLIKEVKCPRCGGKALGNYKNNPHLAKCPECHKQSKPDIFTYK